MRYINIEARGEVLKKKKCRYWSSSQRAAIEKGPPAERGMDFQSAMETFAEAWVAANTKTDQVQVR